MNYCCNDGKANILSHIFEYINTIKLLGIPNYSPKFFTKAHSFLEKNRDFLLHALNKKISSYYVQWNTDFDAWNEDGPIVVMIDETQYEFTAFKLEEYSITVQEIDLSKPLNWYDAGDEIPLVWRKNTFDAINPITGKTIKDIFLIEYNFYYHNSDKNEPVHDKDYDLVGIEFEFHDSSECLSLTNGLDCNAIHLRRTPENVMYRRINIKH